MKLKTRLLLPLGAVLTAAAVFTSGCTGLATPAAAQTPEQPRSGITVVGEGQVAVKPDVAYITLGVQTTGATAQAAMQENANRMTQVIDRIRALGIPDQDIQTSSVDLWPVYSDQSGRPEPMLQQEDTPRITGYRASNNVRITISDVSQAGTILDGVVDVGANTISGIQFSVKDDSQAKQQALAQAITQARQKADAIAQSLGVSITSVSLVQEEFSGGIVAPRMAMAQDAAAGTPIMTGELEVTARVQVTYSFQ